MRVLHVVTDTNVGGAGRYLLALLKAWAEGWPRVFAGMTVACPEGMLEEEIRLLGVPVVLHRGRDVSFSPALTGELLRIIEKVRPDVVHTHACLSARLAARLLRIPVVYTKHGIEPEPAHRGRATVKRVLVSCTSKLLADKVIAVSGAVALSLRRSGVPESMIVTIRNGVDPREFSPVPYDGGAFRRRRLTVGAVARLHRDKGLDILVRAAGMLVQSLSQTRGRSSEPPDVEFVVAGSGPEKETLERDIRGAGLEGIFRLAGHVRDVPGFLRTIDLFVLPSRTEALGLSILEAMASGLAVIASGVGGIPEAVVHGETGYLVPPEDPERLCDAMFLLLSDPELRLAMGRRGRRRVENFFDIRNTAEKTLEVYGELCNSLT